MRTSTHEISHGKILVFKNERCNSQVKFYHNGIILFIKWACYS